jgi:hypothetical protein
MNKLMNKIEIPKTLKKIIAGTVMFALFTLLMAFVYKPLFDLIVSVLWVIAFATTTILLIIGGLTIIGKHKEASKIIDLVVEGSVTAIDIYDFLKLLYKTFIQILKDAVLIMVPYFAYFVAVIVFLLILALYKFIGTKVDVTVPTILMTVTLTFLVGVMTRPKEPKPEPDVPPKRAQLVKFIKQVIASFNRSFIDGFEVAVFGLFLTIDSTNLFFLPDSLNKPLHATLAGHDIMVRGFSPTDASVMFKLVTLGIFIEIIRLGIKLLAEAINYYKNMNLQGAKFSEDDKTILAKALIRVVMARAKNQILRFSAFTSFMIFVFLMFPRLKLVALIATSATSLILDLMFRKRLTFRESEDLLNRVFNRLLPIK